MNKQKLQGRIEARIIVVRVLEMWENPVPYTFEEVSRLNHSYHIVTRM